MNLRQLRYFHVLSEELNFTRAAARCNISQPPLSRAISQLETELGVSLLIRDTHRVALTNAGKSLAEDAARLLTSAGEAADRVRRIARGQRGVLRLGFGGSAPYALWPKLVASFRASAPDGRIVFRSMPVLETVPVYQEKLMVALPADHPLCATTGPIAVDRLSTSAFVAYEPRRGFSYHADLLTLCRLAGFEPTIAHEAPSTEAVIGIVACGEGVAIVPASAERLRMHRVSYRPLRVAETPRSFEAVTFGLAWTRHASSSLVAEFVSHAQAQATLWQAVRPN